MSEPRDHYRATLEMHVGLVDAAENEAERARDGLHWWIGDAVLRGVLTVEEVAEIVGDDADSIRKIVDLERKIARHTGLP